jgi:hypothetical protein
VSIGAFIVVTCSIFLWGRGLVVDEVDEDMMCAIEGLVDEWIGSDWIGLDWIGLDWIGLDWIGLDWIGLVVWIGLWYGYSLKDAW